MSQQEVTNPMRFRKSPHPAARAAAQFKDEHKDWYSGTPVQPAAPVQPVDPVTPVAAPVTPPAEPSQPQQAPLTPVSDITPPADYMSLFSPSTPSAPAKPEPSVEPAKDSDELVNLRKELEDTRAELASTKEKVTLSDELQQLQLERELEKMLGENANEFATIAPEDAKRLLTPVVKMVKDSLGSTQNATKKALDAQQKKLDEHVTRLEQERVQAKVASLHKKLLTAHPDLEQLQKSQAYYQTMTAPVDGSGLTVGQLVAAEFNRGNVDYVINVLNKMKDSQPSLESVAVVSPGSVGSTPAAKSDAPDGQLSMEELADLKFNFQSGRISREQFSAAMKKHREARTGASAN